MAGATYLFLDFDGVLCDSIAECYAASWIGYHDYKGDNPNSVSIADKELFYQFRPYIRDAEDYLVLHYAVENGLPLHGQKEFDALCDSIGEKSLAIFHNQFFVGRKQLYMNDRKTWLSLQPFFPMIQPLLPLFAASGYVHILTSKTSEYVSIILENAGVRWPEDRIHSVKGKEKITFLRTFIDRHSAGSVFFVEDQLDNIIRSNDDRIFPRLAAWGYIREEWRDQTQIPFISEGDFLKLARKVLEAEHG